MEYVLLAVIIILLVVILFGVKKTVKQHGAFDKLLERMNNTESSAKKVNEDTARAAEMIKNYTNIIENNVATIQKILVDVNKIITSHSDNSEKNQSKIEKSMNELFKMLDEKWSYQVETLSLMLKDVGYSLSNQLKDDTKKMDDKFLLRMKNQAKYFSEVLTRLENRTFNRSVQVFGESLKAAYGDFAKQNASHNTEVVFNIQKLILDFLEKLYQMEKAAGDAKQGAVFEMMSQERTALAQKIDNLKSSSTVISEASDDFEVIMSSTGIHNEDELEESTRALDQSELERIFAENILDKEEGEIL